MKSESNHIDRPLDEQQSTKHHESSSLESMDTVSDHRNSNTMNNPFVVCLDQNEPQNDIENQCDDDSSIESDEAMNLQDDSNVDPLSVDEVEEDCLMIGAPNIFTLLALTTRQFLDKHHHKFWFHLMAILGVHGVFNGVQSQFEPNGFHDDEYGMQSMIAMGRNLLSHQRTKEFDPNSTNPNQGFKLNPMDFELKDENDQKFWRDVANSMGAIDSIIIEGVMHYEISDNPGEYQSKDCVDPQKWTKFYEMDTDEKGRVTEKIGFQRNCGKEGPLSKQEYWMSNGLLFGKDQHGPYMSVSGAFHLSELRVITKAAAPSTAPRATHTAESKRAALTTGNVILLLALIAIAVLIIIACIGGIVFILMNKWSGRRQEE